MSIVSRSAKSATATAGTATRREREPSEFDGCWINVGPTMAGATPEENKHVRLPRGIAVSDMQPQRVYATMDPDYAAQVTLVNQVIAVIQDKCRNLAEGESVSINLDVVLYKRQEEAEVEVNKTEIADLSAALFG